MARRHELKRFTVREPRPTNNLQRSDVCERRDEGESRVVVLARRLDPPRPSLAAPGLHDGSDACPEAEVGADQLDPVLVPGTGASISEHREMQNLPRDSPAPHRA